MAAFFTALTVASLIPGTGSEGKQVLLGKLHIPLLGLALVGLLAQIGGWFTPYHGFYDLAFRVAAQEWPGVPAGDRIHLIATDFAYSPLHGHWTYALLSAQGKIPEGPGSEVSASLFGQAMDISPNPVLPEDTAFRHFWWKGLGVRFASPIPAILAWGLFVLLLLKIIQLRRILASVLSRNCR
jgi:hypothetical protein